MKKISKGLEMKKIGEELNFEEFKEQAEKSFKNFKESIRDNLVLVSKEINFNRKLFLEFCDDAKNTQDEFLIELEKKK